MDNKIWNLESFGNNIALWDEFDNKITYHELQLEANKLFKIIGKRCLVFALCRNEVGSILGYVSFLSNEIVTALLSSLLETELLHNLISIYKPEYLWVPGDQAELFHDMEVFYEAYDYVLLRTGFRFSYSLNDQLALLLTTSGSTGSPKFVRQSYKNILENAKSIAWYLKLDDSERPITTLPMNYTYGLSIINSHLLVGATILVTEKGMMQRDFWSFFKRAGATSFGGVPFTYEMLAKMRFFKMDLPTLRTMTQAGGKLHPDFQEEFAKYAQKSGKQFIVMYGQCEATARMGYLPADRAVEKKGSFGIAIPGGHFRLIDKCDKDLSTPYTVGELVYEGENVTLGYAEHGEDLIKGDERHGVLKTGDMALFDEEHFFYIVGRKERYIKVFGNRVNLDELDSLIQGVFETEEASTGIDDHVQIYVTMERFKTDILNFVVKKTHLGPAAFKVYVVAEIPKTDSGKIRYKELEKYHVSKVAGD